MILWASKPCDMGTDNILTTCDSINTTCLNLQRRLQWQQWAPCTLVNISFLCKGYEFLLLSQSTVIQQELTKEHWSVTNLPMAESILSHSSSIKCLMFFSDKVFERARARIRPGVPTTMWGQFFFNTSSSFLMFMPPKKTAIFTLLLYLLNLSYSLLIWKANSLVCASTNTETCEIRLCIIYH